MECMEIFIYDFMETMPYCGSCDWNSELPAHFDENLPYLLSTKPLNRIKKYIEILNYDLVYIRLYYGSVCCKTELLDRFEWKSSIQNFITENKYEYVIKSTVY
jgi:hypothetical protein